MPSASVFSTGACLILCVAGFCQVSSWSYDDVTDWATVYAGHCDGQKQSPINLQSSQVQYQASYKSAVFSFSNFDTVTDISWTIKNNGHTAQVDFGGNAVAQVSGGSLPATFQVAQFHFHWGNDDTKGSEHTVDTLSYPMEMHIVTYNTNYDNLTEAASHADGLAVLGFFFEVSSSDNSKMASIVSGLSNITNADDTAGITPVALQDLMADTADYYRYSGSLTTPNCNEVVTWTVFRDTIKISKAQLGAFRNLKDSHSQSLVNNYRPAQAVNSRTVTSSFEISAAPGALGCTFFTLSATFLLLIWGPMY